MCGELRESNIGEKVVLNGWIQKRRNLGGLIFCDLRDKTGITQIVFNDKIPQELFEQGGHAEKRIRGRQSRERSSMEENRRTRNFRPATSRVICRRHHPLFARRILPPIYIKDDDNVDDNLRLKYRYLDLRKKKMQDNLTFRHNLAKAGQRLLRGKRLHRKSRHRCSYQVRLRKAPRDYLVPSRVNQGRFYALPQSPQTVSSSC